MAKINRSSSTTKAGRANGSIIISPAQREALLRAMKNAGRQSREEREKEQAERDASLERDRLKGTISELQSALKLLQQANEAVMSIADDDIDGIDELALAKFVSLAIEEAGRQFESSLLNLGVLPKDHSCWFADGEIMPITLPQPSAKRPAAEVRHG